MKSLSATILDVDSEGIIRLKFDFLKKRVIEAEVTTKTAQRYRGITDVACDVYPKLMLPDGEIHQYDVSLHFIVGGSHYTADATFQLARADEDESSLFAKLLLTSQPSIYEILYDWVRAHPLKAVGIILATGLAIAGSGLLTGTLTLTVIGVILALLGTTVGPVALLLYGQYRAISVAK